jgi:hypothetical protein
MNRKLLPTLIASLFVAAPAAVAQEGLKLTAGSVGFGGIYSNVTSRNPAEFYEYRDMYSGILGEIDVRTRSDQWWFDGFIENIARTDQFFEVKGASTTCSSTRCTATGCSTTCRCGRTAPPRRTRESTSTLTATFPNLNPASWNDSFNFATDRRNLGGMIEFSNICVAMVCPLRRQRGQDHRRLGRRRVRRARHEPGNGFIDLPLPVDFVTRTWSAGRLRDPAGELRRQRQQEQLHERKPDPELDQPVLWPEPARLGTLSPTASSGRSARTAR